MAVLELEYPSEKRIQGRHGTTYWARFSSDSALLACSGDNQLQLWSVPEGRFLGEVGHHLTAVVNLEFSPKPKFIASGEDGLVRVWGVRRREWIRRIPAVGLTRAVLSRDGKRVAASGISNQSGNITKTQVFDLDSSQPDGPVMVPDGLLMDAAFARDGKSLAMAVSTSPARGDAVFEKNGGSGNIQLWDGVAGRRLGDPLLMPSEPRGVCLHPSGRWLGVCCAEGEGVEIELSTRTVRVLFHHQKPSHAGATLNNGRCAYSPDGRVFAVWGLYQFIHLWDRERGRDLVKPFEPNANTFDLAFQNQIAARAIVASKMRFRTAKTLAHPIEPDMKFGIRRGWL